MNSFRRRMGSTRTSPGIVAVDATANQAATADAGFSEAAAASADAGVSEATVDEAADEAAVDEAAAVEAEEANNGDNTQMKIEEIICCPRLKAIVYPVLGKDRAITKAAEIFERLVDAYDAKRIANIQNMEKSIAYIKNMEKSMRREERRGPTVPPPGAPVTNVSEARAEEAGAPHNGLPDGVVRAAAKAVAEMEAAKAKEEEAAKVRADAALRAEEAEALAARFAQRNKEISESTYSTNYPERNANKTGGTLKKRNKKSKRNKLNGKYKKTKRRHAQQKVKSKKRQ